MGPQKKKDLMSSAFEDFWQSDLKISTPKINTPQLKSSEDNAFDSLWGRGAYQPVKIKPVQQIHYQVPQQKQRLDELRNRLEAQRIQSQINAVNAQQFRENMKNFQNAGRESYNIARGAYRTAAPVVKKAVEVGVPAVKRAARSAVNFIHKATEHPVKPVGLAGAIHESNKKSGKSSIY